MTPPPAEPPCHRDAGADDRRLRLPVHLRRLSAPSLDGAPLPLRGRGSLELTERVLVVHYTRPIAELPEWAVGMIVGGSVVYYLLFARVIDHWLPATARSADPGPLVPAMAAALATWMLVRMAGPARRESLRIESGDVSVVRLDEQRRRVLILTLAGRLIGLEAQGELAPLRQALERSWAEQLALGAIAARPIDRRLLYLLAVALVVAGLLWLGPD